MVTKCVTSPEIKQKWTNLYNTFLEETGSAPRNICLYDCQESCGGIHEGGWTTEVAEKPLKNVCVFNKEQAIREAVALDEFAKDKFGSPKDSYGWATYRIQFEIRKTPPCTITRVSYSS